MSTTTSNPFRIVFASIGGYYLVIVGYLYGSHRMNEFTYSQFKDVPSMEEWIESEKAVRHIQAEGIPYLIVISVGLLLVALFYSRFRHWIYGVLVAFTIGIGILYYSSTEMYSYLDQAMDSMLPEDAPSFFNGFMQFNSFNMKVTNFFMLVSPILIVWGLLLFKKQLKIET